FAVFSPSRSCRSSYFYPVVLHSFPTRRSSDLGHWRAGQRRQHGVPARNLSAHRLVLAGARHRHPHGRRGRSRNLVSRAQTRPPRDRKSTRNSSHVKISYAVFCLKKKKKQTNKT